MVRQQSGFGIAGGVVQDVLYSGDGKVIKTKDTDTKTTDENGDPVNFTQTTIRYVIISTVLGEAVVYQDNQDSRYPSAVNKEIKTSIYGLGNKLGVETKMEGVAGAPNGIVKTTEFKYKSAYESKRLKSEYSTELSNGLASATSISTRGLDANAIRPGGAGQGNADGKLRFEEDFNEWLTSHGCALDGIIAPCSFISKMEGKYGGSYERCPNNNCGPLELAYKALDGSVTPFLGTLIATHDGIDYRLPDAIIRAATMDAMILSIRNHGISGIAFSFNSRPIDIGNIGTVTVNADYAPIDPTGLASLSVGRLNTTKSQQKDDISPGVGRRSLAQVLTSQIDDILNDEKNPCAVALKKANLLGAVKKKLSSINFVSVGNNGNKPASTFAFSGFTVNESLSQFFNRRFADSKSTDISGFATSNLKAIITMDGEYTFSDGLSKEVPIGFLLHELVNHATGRSDSQLVSGLQLIKQEGVSDSQTVSKYFNDNCSALMVKPINISGKKINRRRK